MSSARWVAGSIALALSGAVHAQDDDERRVRIGEAELYPSLRIDFVRDSNVTRVDGDPVEGEAVILRPRLEFRADKRQITLRAGYAGALSSGSEPALDWADHRLDGGVDARLGIRGRVQVGASLAREHEAPGQNLTAGREDLADTPVEFNDVEVLATFTYGAAQALGNVSAGLRYDTRHYVNLTEVTDGRDNARVEPFARFGYRLGGDTRLFAEFSWIDAGFDDEVRDYTAPGLFAGLTFNATGRLVGDVRIGVRDVDFDSPRGQDGAGLFLSGGVDYSPSTISTFSLDLSREVDDSANFVDDGEEFRAIRTRADLTWVREWSARFSTTAYGGIIVRERDCPDLDRTTTTAGIEGAVSIRRWLQVGASFAANTRSTNDCGDRGDGVNRGGLEFDRQVAGVYIRVTR